LLLYLYLLKNIQKDLLENGLDNIKDVTVTPPGFINFIVHPSFYQNKIKSIIKDSENFGKDNIGKGKSANVEFVSANPTGPLTIGHGRNAVLGDTVSNILEWHGYQVTREYYYNDAGKQMRMLGKSVASRYFELLNKASDFPEEGYQGEYIIDIAKRVLDKFGKELDEDDERFLTEAESEIFQQIELSLKSLGISFDKFSNEKTYYESGAIKDLLEELKEKTLVLMVNKKKLQTLNHFYLQIILVKSHQIKAPLL